MLDQTVNEMQSDLIRMRQSSAQVMISRPCKCHCCIRVHHDPEIATLPCRSWHRRNRLKPSTTRQSRLRYVAFMLDAVSRTHKAGRGSQVPGAGGVAEAGRAGTPKGRRGAGQGGSQAEEGLPGQSQQEQLCSTQAAHRPAVASFETVSDVPQDNANTMKIQLEAQQKATDQLISNTRCALLALLWSPWQLVIWMELNYRRWLPAACWRTS